MGTYLITGGAGFFGSILKEELLKAGHICVSIDLEPDEFKHENFTAVQGDIRDLHLLDEIFSKYKFDAIFHCAALLAHVKKELKNLWSSNVDGTKNIAEYAKKYNVKKIVFTSTNCLWGKSFDYPVTEDEKPEPIEIYGKSKLDYFISVSEPYPVIATTSELLSTGADCKMTKLIVLDKTVESMTIFKQIIGRGTRIREKDGKTHFVVMDFRNVTRLFTDPDWDGPVEQDEGFQHGGCKPKGEGHSGGDKNPPDAPVETPIVDRDGCQVKIINKTVSVYDANGKLLRQEDIIDYTRTNIKGEYASLSDFIRKWKASDKKKTIEESFTAMGIDLKALKADQGMEDVDDFDFICYVAYGQKPLTRKERASNVKKKDFFSKYSANAQAVLGILLDKYMNQGITEVEDIKVLSLADFANFGKPAKIVKLFGGKAQYEAAIRELEENIYEFEVV